MASRPLLQEDLDHVLAHTAPLWREMAGARLFITGGTGFFGKWLLESIATANGRLGCKVSATVLSRDPANFMAEMPHLAHRTEFEWLRGDVSNFQFPAGRFDYIFHMATAASAKLNDTRPLEMLDTIVGGTRRVLDFARHCGARRLLLTSSGAVYGPQPADLSHIPEDYQGGPDPLAPASAYAEGKRMAELLCTLTPEVDCIIARCFAFIGPHLPLNAHFAAGNFIRDALAGGAIHIHGDGTPRRSYLYAGDLLIWLLTLLLRGQCGLAYNVGSDEAIRIGELAEQVVRQMSIPPEILIKGSITGAAPGRDYVPSTELARLQLGLGITVDLPTAIRRSMVWAKASR
jgi:dTDP-glucose 4,6-dehydratase